LILTLLALLLVGIMAAAGYGIWHLIKLMF